MVGSVSIGSTIADDVLHHPLTETIGCGCGCGWIVVPKNMKQLMKVSEQPHGVDNRRSEMS